MYTFFTIPNHYQQQQKQQQQQQQHQQQVQKDEQSFKLPFWDKILLHSFRIPSVSFQKVNNFLSVQIFGIIVDVSGTQPFELQVPDEGNFLR